MTRVIDKLETIEFDDINVKRDGLRLTIEETESITASNKAKGLVKHEI